MTDSDVSARIVDDNPKGQSGWRSKVKDWLADIDQFIDDRLKSPFMLSLIFSWLVLNWEVPVAMVFEFETVTVERIGELLDGQSLWRHLWPFVISLLYVIALRPLLNLFAAWGKWLHGVAQKVSDNMLKNTPITHVELAREKKRVQYLELKSQRAIIDQAKSDTLVKELEGQVAVLANDNELLQEKYDALKAESGNELQKLSGELNEKDKHISELDTEKLNLLQQLGELKRQLDFVKANTDLSAALALDEQVRALKVREGVDHSKIPQAAGEQAAAQISKLKGLMKKD